MAQWKLSDVRLCVPLNSENCLWNLDWWNFVVMFGELVSCFSFVETFDSNCWVFYSHFLRQSAYEL